MKSIMFRLLNALLLIPLLFWLTASAPLTVSRTASRRTAAPPLAGAAAADSAVAEDAAAGSGKTETVYALLDYSGQAVELSVVNGWPHARAGTYTDFGRYTAISNLSGLDSPQIVDDRITWTLDDLAGALYYEGRLSGGELPYILHLSCSLNGQPIPADQMAAQLAGQSGHLRIQLHVEPNPRALAYFRQYYICQIQLPLNLDYCQSVQAEAASTVQTGRTVTLAWMILPGRSLDAVIELDVRNFQFAGLTAACLPFSTAGLIDINTADLDKGLAGFREGIAELADGTGTLKTGAEDLTAGLTQMADAGLAIKKSSRTLSKGIGTYMAGISQAAEGAQILAAGADQLSQGGSQLQAGYAQLEGGVGQLLGDLLPLLAGLTPERQAAYQAQITGLQQGLADFGQNLGAYSQGVADNAAGQLTLAQNLQLLAANGQDLAAGSSRLAAGFSDLSGGLSLLTGQAAGLPEGIGRLQSGQEELAAGFGQFDRELQSALAEYDLSPDAGTAVPSFVSSKNRPQSVQFILRTPEIKPASTADATAPDLPSQSFWDRLAALFS